MALLCEHFARDSLAVEELERRIDAAHRAASVDELHFLLADLPGGATALQGANPTPRPSESSRWEKGGVEPASRGTVLAILGGARRRGSWTPARTTTVVALWGGVELDFREAHLAPGVTEVRAVALMGGVDIVVPPGVRVESDGFAVLGGFDHVVDEPPAAGAPVLHLTGGAVLGGVNVTVRRIGESKWSASGRRLRKRFHGKRSREGRHD